MFKNEQDALTIQKIQAVSDQVTRTVVLVSESIIIYDSKLASSLGTSVSKAVDLSHNYVEKRNPLERVVM